MTEEQNAVASQEQETVSQEPEQEASQVQDSKIQEEIEKRAQSEADKRVKVFEQKLRDLQAEHRVELRKFQEQLESERKAAEERSEEAGLDVFLKTYVNSGELTETSVPPIRDWAKKILERNKQADEKERKAAEALRKAEEEVKEVAELKATRTVLKLAAQEGVSLPIEDAEAIAKKTQGNLDWVKDILQAKVTSPTKDEKSKPKRPDSSSPTAPGGKLTDTQLREQYIAGKISDENYEKECKVRGIQP